jgi:hypothetical protein
MASNPLIGTWALVATQWKRADGRHANPWGDGATGVLTYDAAGQISAQVMRAGRPGDPAAPAGIDAAMAAGVPGYIAYFGSYEIHGDVVEHTVAGASLPAWVGTTHRRRFAVEGDRLTLSDDVIASDGVAVQAATTWQRISPA